MPCGGCGRDVYPLHYYPTKVARVTHKLRHGQWLCDRCLKKRLEETTGESCGVAIPHSLVEKLPGAHYIKVAKCSKRPVEREWPQHPMKPDDPSLQRHLARGGNYGVVGGSGIVILDADMEEIKRAVTEYLPRTFTVQSPGSLGWHCYYRSNLKKPIRLYDVKKGGKRVNVGDVQGAGKMVVGPGCFHPNGKRYEIIVDLPFAYVSEGELREALGPWTVSNKAVEALTRRARRETHLMSINILDVVALAGLRKQGGEYYGPHPVPSHGSTTGRNFWVNPSKNVWHCFRHDTGGGPLLWVAVEEAIIRCEEALPGALKGEVFRRVLEAVERRGFKVPEFLKAKTWENSYEVVVEGVKIGHFKTQEYKLRG